VFSVNNQTSVIETLTGNNYKRWKEDVEMALTMMDIDIVMREPKPPALTAGSSASLKAHFERWDRANRLSLMMMKRSISEALIGALPKTDNAKEFLVAIGQKFQFSNKAETGELMGKLMGMRYDGIGGIREFIMKMANVANRLSKLKISVPDTFLVHQILGILPSQFNQLKTSYNTQKEVWSINELISFCAQEEERMRRETGETMNVVSNQALKNLSTPKDQNLKIMVVVRNKVKPTKLRDPKLLFKKIKCVGSVVMLVIRK
jgi:hypothetical protein